MTDNRGSENVIQNNFTSKSHSEIPVDKKEQSFAKSFRASIQKVSNLYEQASKVYSKMSETSELDPAEQPFKNDKIYREKSKSLLDGTYSISINLGLG